MSHAYRVLGIVFESRKELDCEYFTNLVNGGLFIPGAFDLLQSEPVMVFVDLPFAGSAIELEGCVAQLIPVELEANGGRCGVALELQNSPEQIRRNLEVALGERMDDDLALDGGKRVAPRSVAEVRARVCVPGAAELEGCTRNLSLAGVLVKVSGETPPVGQDVRVVIAHPKTGEERSIPGMVARREVDDHGRVCGLGIQFSVDDAIVEETSAYLNRVKASEHARRLGGISGSISTLGLGDLLSSIGRCVPSGRYTLSRAGEVGTIQINAGLIGGVQVGEVCGIEALVRMLEWEDGSFEFHATQRSDHDETGLGMPIEAVLLEGARLVDEGRRIRESGSRSDEPEGTG